jgi:hypothetical protein
MLLATTIAHVTIFHLYAPTKFTAWHGSRQPPFELVVHQGQA